MFKVPETQIFYLMDRLRIFSAMSFHKTEINISFQGFNWVLLSVNWEKCFNSKKVILEIQILSHLIRNTFMNKYLANSFVFNQNFHCFISLNIWIKSME